MSSIEVNRVKIKNAIEEGMREILNYPFLEWQQLCKSGNV